MTASPAELERARLRRMGILFIAGLAVAVLIATLLLVGSDESRDAVVVDARELNVSVEDGDVVRVSGTTSPLFDDDELEDLDQSNALDATAVMTISRDQAASMGGTISLRELLEDDEQGRRVTVVGEVIDETDRGIIAIGRLDE